MVTEEAGEAGVVTEEVGTVTENRAGHTNREESKRGRTL
jgi:hypothetical protein